MLKEHEKFRAEQEIKKAAELKAKLEMVETRARSPRRAPRKIGTMVCDTGFKTGYRNAGVSFVLRLDHDGTFIAEHGDVWYCSKSRDALKAKMDQVAKVTFDLRWTRYLHVKYEAIADSDRWGGHTYLKLSDKRKKDDVVGMMLTWEVVEYSDAINLPGVGVRYMKREVTDGKPSDNQESVPGLPDGIVEHTKEREDVLHEIQKAFSAIDEKMLSMFRGTPHHVARALDAVDAGGPRLLEAPEAKRRKLER